MIHEMNRVQSKYYNRKSHRINKICCLLMMTKTTYIYLKIDLIGCHISINLLVSYVKNNFIENG